MEDTEYRADDNIPVPQPNPFPCSGIANAAITDLWPDDDHVFPEVGPPPAVTVGTKADLWNDFPNGPFFATHYTRLYKLDWVDPDNDPLTVNDVAVLTHVRSWAEMVNVPASHQVIGNIVEASIHLDFMTRSYQIEGEVRGFDPATGVMQRYALKTQQFRTVLHHDAIVKRLLFPVRNWICAVSNNVRI